MKILTCLLAVALAACDAKPPPTPDAAPVMLYVASSLKEAVIDIANEWSTARLACCAHDIMLAAEAPRGLSARNVFPLGPG